jgi:hypothetical protein
MKWTPGVGDPGRRRERGQARVVGDKLSETKARINFAPIHKPPFC